MSDKKWISVFAVLLAGVLWGTMGIFVRSLAQYGLDSVQIAGLRIGSAALLLMLSQAVFSPQNLRIRLRDFGWFCATGICSILLMSLLYFQAISMTSLSVAAILLYTAPVIVMVVSILLFKEKITATKIVALLFAFAGCVLVAGIGSGLHISAGGFLVGLGSGFAYASYSILGTFVLRKYSPQTLTAYSFLMAAVGCLFVCRPVETFRTIFSSGHVPLALLLVLLMGIVTAVAPFSLYSFGLKNMEASKASIFASVEPMVATVIGFVVYREALDILSYLGIVLILLAVLILNCFGHKTRKTN